METVAYELKDLAVREQVRACLARIARGEDRRDEASLAASYWPDARVDFGVFSGNFAEYLAWVVPGSLAVLLTQHFLGQSLIELEPERVRALAETHVLSYHRIDMGTSQRDMVLGGRYLDILQKRGAEWRLRQIGGFAEPLDPVVEHRAPRDPATRSRDAVPEAHRRCG